MKKTFFLLGLGLVGCQAQPATSAVLQELSFTQPCSSLGGFFASKNVNMRGDPLGAGQKASLFMEDSVFRVVEIGCTRIKSQDGTDSEPMPVTITFYSGGADTNDRLTNASLRLDKKLVELYGEPSKKYQTGRWESTQWLVGVTRVRHFESTPSDTRDLRVEFSLYPTNDVKALDASLDQFLQLLEKEPLAPPSSDAQ